MALNPRQQKFVDEYLRCGNAAEAYRRAGYSCKNPQVAAAGGERLLRNAEIRASIEKAQAELREDEIFSRRDWLKGVRREAENPLNRGSERISAYRLAGEALGYIGDARILERLDALEQGSDESGDSQTSRGTGTGEGGPQAPPPP